MDARAARGPLVMRAMDPGVQAVAESALRSGGLVAVPTETVYGIACALDDAATRRLLDAKRRPPTKGITLFVDGLDQAEPLALLPDTARQVATRFWPGPLTIVAPVRPGAKLPPEVTGGLLTIGLRVPDHPVPRALVRALGPLPTTSANLSGEPDATTIEEVVRALGAWLDLAIDGGTSPGGVPSTVILFAHGDARPRLLRAGGLSFGEIEAVIAGPLAGQDAGDSPRACRDRT